MKKLVALLFSLLFCSPIFAAQFKEIVFLGDSLSDSGNLYNIIKIVPKSPPYYHGRFTNGPTWAELVGKHFNDSSSTTFVNYCYGGATSILHNIFYDSFIAPITLTGEVYSYLLGTLFTDKSNTLYAIWIGANDYLYDRHPDLDALTNDVVANIEWAMNTLRSQGATQFLIMNLPDLSRTPLAKDENLVDRLHTISLIHNKKLSEMVKKIQSEHSDIHITFVDVFNIFNDLLDNTEKFNQQHHTEFNNLTQACWTGGVFLKNNPVLNINSVNADLQKAFANTKLAKEKNFNTLAMSKFIVNSPSLAEAYSTTKLAEAGGQACENTNQYVFFDHLHPTAAVHVVFADIVVKNLEA